jgi:hypothetical protein
MPKKLEFLAIVPNDCNDEVVFRAYFLCRQTNQLISVKVTPDLVDFTLRKGIGQKFILVNFVSLFKKFQIRKIILEKGSKRYKARLRTKKTLIPTNIVVPFYAGFMVSQLLNIPIEIENKTLKKEGIYIDRKLLEASLT